MPDEPIAGRSLVTRRAVIDIVRRVTLGSYGVAGFAGNWLDRLLGSLERRPGGLHVSMRGGSLAVSLRLRVAHGLPIAEVARQVESSIRYALRTAIGRDVDRLTIRVARLESTPVALPPKPSPHPAAGVAPSDLADSGSDVA